MGEKKGLFAVGLLVLSALACQLSSGEALPTVAPTARPTQTSVATVVSETSVAPTSASLNGDETLPDIKNMVRAVVQIFILAQEGEEFVPLGTGSGTIVSPDGYILTNAHVATGAGLEERPDALGIAVTERSDEPPSLLYLAEIAALDERLDLAVLRIATDLGGRPVDAAALNLAYIPLGDSDLLELGDQLRIFGYPGIGGETITFSSGSVSGFTREPGVEGRAYIKTDATIAGGNSGGLGADLAGKIVGVPTQVGYGGAERFADCRYLADTNGDGWVDEEDNCIPVGGFINALRPVNLSKGLIEAARLGIARPTPQAPVVPSAQPRLSRLFFAPDVTEQDWPTTVVTALPSGSTQIYFFFDYENMQDGIDWEARWSYEGEYDLNYTSGPWEGGESGTWWVSRFDDAGLADGEYGVQVYVEGEKLAESTLTVGGAEPATPAFSNLVFAQDVDAQGNPVGSGHLLPAGMNRLYAFFDYTAMREGLTWRRVWYYEGESVAEGEGTWDAGANGTDWVALDSDTSLAPGVYRLELYIEERLAVTADVAVAGQAGELAFGPITFAAGVDASGQPVDPADAFPSGLEVLYVFWEYSGMRDGLDWEERWLWEGEEIVRFDFTWQDGKAGYFWDNLYRSNDQPLSDGTYTLELYVEGQLVQTGTAIVGSGLAPTPEPSPVEDGLLLQGYILDADTERGIPEAGLVVLQPGVSAAGWEGDETQVYTWAVSDRNGYFELPLPLERGQRYSLIVGAEGYLPLLEEDVLVSDEPSPLDVTFRLQRP